MPDLVYVLYMQRAPNNFGPRAAAPAETPQGRPWLLYASGSTLSRVKVKLNYTSLPLHAILDKLVILACPNEPAPYSVARWLRSVLIRFKVRDRNKPYCHGLL